MGIWSQKKLATQVLYSGVKSTGYEDTAALENKKGLTVFSAKPVVDCLN